MLVYNCFSNFSNWIFPSRFHLELSKLLVFLLQWQWCTSLSTHCVFTLISWVNSLLKQIYLHAKRICARVSLPFVVVWSKCKTKMKQTSLNEITFTKFNQLQLKPLPKNNTCFCVCFDVCNVIILIFPVWPFSMLNNNCQFDELLFFFYIELLLAMVLIQILQNHSSIFKTLQTK